MEKSLYSTMNSKGQVTIPAAISNKLHLRANNKFEFIDKALSNYFIPSSYFLRFDKAQPL